MILHLIGQLIEVKPTEYEDKKTGKVNYGTEITVLFEGVDEEGYKKVTAEAINVDEEDYDRLVDKKGKTVAIAYTVMTGKNGTYFYPDRSMPVLVLEKNPLDYSAYIRSQKDKKA